MITLTINFHGLCLFANDTSNNDLHVFLPRAPGTGGHPGPKDRHFAAVRYNEPATGHEKLVLIEDSRFDIPATAGPVTLPFGTGIENLSEHWSPKAKLAVDLQTGGLRHLLNAHFVIPGATAMPVKPMGYWEVDVPQPHGGVAPKQCTMAPHVVCVGHLDAATLNLHDALSYGADLGLDELTGPAITLDVLHVEEDQLKPNPHLPGRPWPGDVSDHFPGFRKLFDKATGPDARFIDADAHAMSGMRALHDGLTPFSCMSGGGEFGP